MNSWTSWPRLVRAESMSRTSLAKCFLCFWMLGMSTCKRIKVSAERKKKQRFYVNEEHILLEIESAAL